MRRLNERGSSVLEIVIMSGVMVAMLTAFMSLISHEAKNVTYLEDKLSCVALESELRMQFLNPDYCKGLLEDIIAPRESQTKDIIRSLTQATQMAALEKIFQKRGRKTVYDQLELKGVTLEDSDLGVPNSSGFMNVVFYSERMRKGGGPPSLQPIKIKTRVSVGAGYKIVSCSGESEGGSKQSCILDSMHYGYLSYLEKRKRNYQEGDEVPEGAAFEWVSASHSGGGREGVRETTRHQSVCINAKWVDFTLQTTFN